MKEIMAFLLLVAVVLLCTLLFIYPVLVFAQDVAVRAAPAAGGSLLTYVFLAVIAVVVGLFFLRRRNKAAYDKVISGGQEVGHEIATGASAAASAVSADLKNYHAAVQAADAARAPTAAPPPTTK